MWGYTLKQRAGRRRKLLGPGMGQAVLGDEKGDLRAQAVCVK